MEWYWYVLIVWLIIIPLFIAFGRFLHNCDEDMHNELQNQKKGDAK